MKILISNDDGVYAPGIESLNQFLKKKFDTFVVAPLEERSTTGHTLSLDNPLRVVEVEENVYGCSGYPADCTLMGFGKLMDDKPDLIVSGINRGANLGQDIYYSGTAAAAREGIFHGIPAIAVSLVCDFHRQSSEGMNFDTAAEFLMNFITPELKAIIPPLHLININVPDEPLEKIKGIKICDLGIRRYSEEITQRQDFRGRDYYWIGGVYQGFEGDENTDCQAVDEGYISISILNLLGKKAEKIEEWKKYCEEFSLS
jgi:5'-nucleotidase